MRREGTLPHFEINSDGSALLVDICAVEFELLRAFFRKLFESGVCRGRPTLGILRTGYIAIIIDADIDDNASSLLRRITDLWLIYHTPVTEATAYHS